LFERNTVNINYMLYIPGGPREMLIGLGAVRTLIDCYPHNISFHFLADSEETETIAKLSGMASSTTCVASLLTTGVNPLNAVSGRGDVHCRTTLVTTLEDAVKFGEQERDRKVAEFKSLAPGQDPPDIVAAPLNACTTALFLLAKDLRTYLSIEWNPLDTPNYYHVPPYCRVTKAIRESAKALLRYNILLEDGSPVGPDPFILVDLPDESLRERVADELYTGDNPADAYPLFLVNGRINGTSVGVMEVAGLVANPGCVMVIGSNDSYLPSLGGAFKVNTFCTRNLEEWPDITTPGIILAIGEDTLREKVLPALGSLVAQAMYSKPLKLA